MPSLARATDLMELLGLTESHRGYVAPFEATCVFTEGNAGSPIEFVVPTGGPLATFNRGAGGLHHIAIEVHSLEAVERELERRRMRLLEPAPVPGAGDFVCNFLAPGYAYGVIVEFIEKAVREGGSGASSVTWSDRVAEAAPADLRARVDAALQIANGTGVENWSRRAMLIPTTDKGKRRPC
jgi:methylmalonyl-CoA/ethylmalonyl-CoA epimerase